MSRSARYKLAVACTLLLAVAAIVGWSVRGRVWQRWQIDRDWSRSEIRVGRTIIAALDEYRQREGEYPETLDLLVPSVLENIPVPVPHPSGNGGERWKYRRLGEDDYQLSVSMLHWVSSYDELLYFSSRQCPPDWGAKRYVEEIDDWFYVIGAQKLSHAR